jgi:hypothetical protein
MRGFQTNSFFAVCLVCLYITFRFGLSWPPSGDYEEDLLKGGEQASIADALAYPIAEKYPKLGSFVDTVRDGEARLVRGVYVPGVFAFPVVQQPQNNPIYVSNKQKRITQFAKAAENGVTGLLAHNYLSGELFYQLTPGQEVIVVYGDGALHRYRISLIRQFQKLEPTNLHSNFVDLQSGQNLTAKQVFDQFYRGEPHLIFQTCLKANRMWDWGITFIVATPLDKSFEM